MIRWGKRLFCMVLGLVALVVCSIYLVPAILGYNLAVVYSGSMEPVMPVGALALMGPIDPSEVEIGDIIAFNPVSDPDAIVSHRVVEILGDSASIEFRTNGDANEEPDMLSVPAANVLARVTYNIPYMGFALARIGDHTRSQLGFIFLIGLPTVLLIGSAAKDLHLMTSPGRRRITKRAMLLERRKKRRSRR
ncbi:MAG TPA: signal peptidase I [Dehalococcoidia bacterium]|nr:signal peptidase I [Dehalococcoidia bacterium]